MGITHLPTENEQVGSDALRTSAIRMVKLLSGALKMVDGDQGRNQ